MYAKGFFDLQLRFADRVAALSGLPRARALLEYTNLYIRFGLGRAFDPLHPEWREYVAGLEGRRDAGEWTYRFYLARATASAGPPVEATVGCFSFSRVSEERVRLHFVNAERDGFSPLAVKRAGLRVEELAALFEHLRRTARQPQRVMGASWLYNIEAYRRLFPPSYVASARPRPHRFQNMPLWGQFVDRHGEPRERMTRPFLECLERANSVEQLDRCFPLSTLVVEAPAQDFFDYYPR